MYIYVSFENRVPWKKILHTIESSTLPLASQWPSSSRPEGDGWMRPAGENEAQTHTMRERASLTHPHHGYNQVLKSHPPPWWWEAWFQIGPQRADPEGFSHVSVCVYKSKSN